MSIITDEITAIETYVRNCFDQDFPIDPVKVKRLGDLRIERLNELVQTKEQRDALMKHHTRTLTSKLIGLKSNGRPDVLEKIHEEMDKYDKAAVFWATHEAGLWEESEASSIAAGILILANEIH